MELFPWRGLELIETNTNVTGNSVNNWTSKLGGVQGWNGFRRLQFRLLR